MIGVTPMCRQFNAPRGSTRHYVSKNMKRNDLSWGSFFVLLVFLLAAHIVFRTLVTNEPIISGLKSFGIATGIVGFFYVLAYRTIRWRGGLQIPSGPPHPRFPNGKHPRPRIHILVSLTAILVLINLVASTK